MKRIMFLHLNPINPENPFVTFLYELTNVFLFLISPSVSEAPR